MLKDSPQGCAWRAKVDKLVAGQAQLGQHVGEVFIHQPQRELIVAGRDGGVGGEDIAVADDFGGLLEGLAFGHQLAHALQRQEGRVTFVHVPDIRAVAQQAQGAHAAHAQQDFLRDAHFQIVAVQAAVSWRS